jgi:hypothetical protein
MLLSSRISPAVRLSLEVTMTVLTTENTEEEDKKIKDAHLNYMVYDAEVLVTGEVPNEGIRNYVVTQIPLKDFKISRVASFIFLSSSSVFPASRLNDMLLSSRISPAVRLSLEVTMTVLTTDERRQLLKNSVLVIIMAGRVIFFIILGCFKGVFYPINFRIF